MARARDPARDTYPQLTVLHDNRIHDIGHIFTAVGAVLQEGVDVTPGDDLERILAVDMQVAHSVDVELVGLGLDRVDLDDEFAQGLGLAVVGKLDHQVLHGAAGIGHLVGDHDGIGMDALDVGEVDALHDALDTVEHGVERASSSGPGPRAQAG